jgi:UPF0176 protein
MHKVLIRSFYKFHPLISDQLTDLAAKIEARGEELGLRGLAIIGAEGCNATLSGEPEALRAFCNELLETLNIPGELSVKESYADLHPFRRFKVKVREEIVTLGKPEVLPLQSSHTHLSPEDWHKALQEEDVVVLDTRNWYETKIGKFKKAIDPNLDEFQEFPDYLRKANIPKDKKVLIYCTGGIRCEKAIVEMHEQGYQNVFQLDGGILNYLEKFPNQEFDGECFVFDHRVAVDQSLQPTARYRMCPHCGQPGESTVICRKCDAEAVICEECLKNEHMHTCSKNCAYHYQMDRERKGPQQKQGYRFDASGMRIIK